VEAEEDGVVVSRTTGGDARRVVPRKGITRLVHRHRSVALQ
jgi:hypothetical protein